MRVRFTQCIAAAEWSYDSDQEVTVGTALTYDEVPQELAEKWLASGLLVRVEAAPETAMVGGRETGMRPAGRRR